jgi:hypothetical protein
MPSQPNKGVLRLAAWTFVAAWALRLVAAYTVGSFFNLGRSDMERIAKSVVERHAFAGELAPGVPTAGESPGYVLVIALLFQLFGQGVFAEVIKVLACTAMASLRCALSVWLAAQLGMGRAVVFVTAVFSVLWIGALGTELQGDWDPPYTAVWLILLLSYHMRSSAETRTPLRSFLLGAAWTLAAYFNFTILSIAVGMCVRDVIANRAKVWPAIQRSLCVAAGVIVVLSPWAIRNRIVLGEWLFTRTLLGYNLSISYRDGAHWSEPVNNHPSSPGKPDDISISPAPWLNEKLQPEVQRMGEVAWDRQQKEKGVRWILAHPGTSLRLMAQHAFFFWFPPWPGAFMKMLGAVPWPFAIAQWMLTLMAALGLVRLWKKAPDAAKTLGVALLWFPLAYYLVSWSSRYRAPIEWILVLLAAVAIGGILDDIRQGRATDRL